MLLGCKTKGGKMLLKLSIIVWPMLEMNPVFLWPMSHTHAEKSSTLCSLAAEVQMVCLYASLTQCRCFTSALLCLFLLDSVHHSSTPDILLGFALSSLCHTLQLSHFFLSICSLNNTVYRFSLNVKKQNKAKGPSQPYFCGHITLFVHAFL